MRHICMRKTLLVAAAILLLPVTACDHSTPAPHSSGAAMPSSTPSSRGDPDNPQDRVGAPIVLTGTVDTTGPCVILTVAGHRWALLGEPIGQLTDQQTVTVRGRPATMPPGCDAASALTVRSIT
jgi:hypothetical protein